jgi:hypothetical protein
MANWISGGLFIKPLFQFPVIIRCALIFAIIKEQEKRQTVRRPVLDNAGAAFSVIGTFFFGQVHSFTFWVLKEYNWKKLFTS